MKVARGPNNNFLEGSLKSDVEWIRQMLLYKAGYYCYIKQAITAILNLLLSPHFSSTPLPPTPPFCINLFLCCKIYFMYSAPIKESIRVINLMSIEQSTNIKTLRVVLPLVYLGTVEAFRAMVVHRTLVRDPLLVLASLSWSWS